MTELDRVAATQRPPGPRQGTQRWGELLFSHWQVPEAALAPHIPAGLTIDQFDGRCFVGVVAFSMQRVRPFGWKLPPVPTTTDFGEINVRTYVHHEGREPGVLFLSLDASSFWAVWAARTFWHLPYFYGSHEHLSDGLQQSWKAKRRSPRVEFEARCEVGEPLAPSKPGTLEFFLAERYLFYCAKNGELLRGRVHHAPYPLHRAKVSRIDDTLLSALGLPATGERTPDFFSPGVHVEMFKLETVTLRTPG